MRLVTVGYLVLLASLGCNGNQEKETRIRVVCTTGMVADMVANVGGERVVIELLMGPDVDPHLFKASLEDVAKLRKADIICYSGLHLEGKMAEILDNLGKSKPTFAVADSLQAKQFLKDDDKTLDPHLWFDVALWSQGAAGVAKVLADFDKAHADEYGQLATVYRKKLEALHEEVKKQIASIPPKQRVLVTSHDAFRYFGRAYGIEVKSVQGISTDAEPSVKDINDLVNFICRRSIKAVFVESSVPARSIRSVLEGCASRMHKVVEGGTLYSDALGKAGTPEATYEGMIRHNVETIVKALR